MKIASITDPTTADGLKLAGIEEAHEAEDEREVGEKFEKLGESEDVGIIAITEELAQKINEKISEFREEREGITPIVIEIPSKEGPIPERREIIDKLITRAVGAKVKK